MPLLLCVSLCGCFHFRSQEYPPGWPALHTGQGDCSSIAGTYADSGERIGDNSFEFDSLSSALGQYKALVVAAPTDRVAISFGEDGTMVVKVWAKKAVVGAMQFSHDGGEFQCRWGEIEISRSRFSAAEQVAGWESDTVRLSKAADGSLILRRSNSAYGVAGGIIPIVANAVVSWSRFAVAKSH